MEKFSNKLSIWTFYPDIERSQVYILYASALMIVSVLKSNHKRFDTQKLINWFQVVKPGDSKAPQEELNIIIAFLWDLHQLKYNPQRLRDYLEVTDQELLLWNQGIFNDQDEVEGNSTSND